MTARKQQIKITNVAQVDGSATFSIALRSSGDDRSLGIPRPSWSCMRQLETRRRAATTPLFGLSASTAMYCVCCACGVLYPIGPRPGGPNFVVTQRPSRASHRAMKSLKRLCRPYATCARASLRLSYLPTLASLSHVCGAAVQGLKPSSTPLFAR